RLVGAGCHAGEGAVGEGHAHALTLPARHVRRSPESPVPARGLEALPAEVAGSVRPGEGGDDEAAGAEVRDLRPDLLHDADELVAHRGALGRRGRAAVRLEVAAAY